MKKLNFLKTLFVAAGLLVGASTWAQTVTTYDFEDGEALFTADSRITANVVEGTQTIYNQDFELDGKAVSFKGAGNAQNGYCFAHFDFSSLCDQAAKVKVEFETVLGNGARSIISVGDAAVRGNTGNSSKTTYSNKGAIFRLGTDKNNSYVNDANVGNSATLSQKWLKVTLEVDETAKTYTYSIVDKATDNVLYDNGENPIGFYSADAVNCTQIDMFGYINNSQLGLIDNLVITVTKDERKQADYTVNFLDINGKPIIDPVTRSGAVGDGINLIPSDKEPLWNADGTQKYFYKSDDAEGTTIAEDGTTVVNIVYRDAEVYNYTVVSSLNTTLVTGSGFEGENLRIGYPRYQLDGQDIYMAGVDNKEYRTTVALTEDNVTKTVNYTKQEGKTVVFYTEAEDIEGMTLATNDNIPVRASNAKAAVSSTDVAFTTLPKGKYIIHAGIFTSKSSYSGLSVNFGVGVDVIFNAEFGSVNLNEVASSTIELYAGKSVVSYLSSSSANTQFDYIWIEKVGDVELVADVPVSVTEAGYATYCSRYDLDLSGVNAYTATVEGAKVSFKRQNGKVAAGTGLLIKAEKGTVKIPVVAEEGADVVADNAFIGVLADTEVAAGAFVLANGAQGVGFYKTTAAAGFTVGANTAYLPASIVPAQDEPVETRFIALDGEATGIVAVGRDASRLSNELYNLNGQRVANAQKGLYIVNGKKVVMK